MVMAALIVGTMVMINRLTGPHSHSRVKGEAFECGNEPSGPAWTRYSVRFYLTAILFLVFDVEVILLVPWGVEIRRLGLFGLIEALIFIAILALGLVYAWQRGALDWD
jgi:NADH-quinone oxidoreductase subunit A